MTVQTSSDKAMVFRVGYCIYCGCTNDLRKEHVVPFGLGGGVILLAASCKRCADITKVIEDYCLKKTFGIFRAKHKFPTRRKRERPTHALLSREADEEKVNFEASLDDIPSMINMPLVADVPAITAVKPRMYGEIKIANFVRCERQGDVARTTEKFGDCSIETVFYSDQFFRMLAKIAHGLITAFYNTKKMRPFLLDIILEGNLKAADAFVGDSDSELPAQGIHQFRVFTIKLRNGKFVVGAHLRLFAVCNPPTYQVVVGEFDEYPTCTNGAHLERA